MVESPKAPVTLEQKADSEVFDSFSSYIGNNETQDDVKMISTANEDAVR